MDGENDESIDYMIFDMAVFCKGSISHKELEAMPISKIYNLNEFADKMVKDAKREADKQQQRGR